MRKFILAIVLLFPLMSGIVSVTMADPANEEPVAGRAHDPETTIVAARLAR